MFNKTLKLGLLAAALVASPSIFADNTVSVGYANVKAGDIKLKGVNAKYRYEFNSPMSIVVSGTHAKDDQNYYFVDSDGDFGEGVESISYNSLLVGPAYRFNDYVSVYGLVGAANTKYEDVWSYYDYAGLYKYDESKTSFAYGVGVEVNPVKNLAISLGYEGSKVYDTRTKGFILSAGYRF